MSWQCGDVVFAALPASSPHGHEQKGGRPAIVVAGGPSLAASNFLIVVPFTTSVSATRFPFTFEVKASTQNGLDRDSIALTFQIRAIDRSRIGRTLGRLSDSALDTLKNQLRGLLGV